MTRRMRDSDFRAEQHARVREPHIAPINDYVDHLRTVGRGWVPYVAPLHGGVDARVLSILRDPGPATRAEEGSGFICVENDDGSAALQSELLAANGLTPRDVLPWNAYPWYVNRAPTGPELDAGAETVAHLLTLAPHIEVVLLQGRDAEKAWSRVLRRGVGQGLPVVVSLHPSSQALFHRDADERARRAARREQAFREVATILGRTPRAEASTGCDGGMQLVFVYQPVTDLDGAAAFHRDTLGWEEAWRDGDDTVAFWMPGRVAQVMLSHTEQPAGPMYRVDDLAAWIAAHPSVEVSIPAYAIPGGAVAGFTGPGGNVFYVFDQPDA